MALFIARLGEARRRGTRSPQTWRAVLWCRWRWPTPPACWSTGIGAGEPRRARWYGFTGLGVGLAVALVVAALVATAATPIARFYTGDTQVAGIAAPPIALVAGFHIFDGTNAIAANALRGYKKALIPMLAFARAVGGRSGWRLCAGLLRRAGRARGAAGFWQGAIAGMALAAISVTIYFERVSRAALRSSHAPGTPAPSSPEQAPG